MKQNTGPCTYEEKAALILSDVRQAMYADFQNKHTAIKLSYSQWKASLKELVWNMKKERQTAELEFDPKQRWRLERDLDGDTRRVCEAT
tara:strand:+ start:780 stop:1046 length:267 start_codon:yes stop_codon:yes gene_type:complete